MEVGIGTHQGRHGIENSTALPCSIKRLFPVLANSIFLLAPCFFAFAIVAKAITFFSLHDALPSNIRLILFPTSSIFSFGFLTFLTCIHFVLVRVAAERMQRERDVRHA